MSARSLALAAVTASILGGIAVTAVLAQSPPSGDARGPTCYPANILPPSGELILPKNFHENWVYVRITAHAQRSQRWKGEFSGIS